MLANFMAWIDKRLPLTDAWNKHLAQYPAPKNFNFWYFFGYSEGEQLHQRLKARRKLVVSW